MSPEDNDPPPPYEAQDPLSPIAAPALTQTFEPTLYHVYCSRAGNYRFLLPDDQNPCFYINSRTLRTPDLTIHRGNGYYDREIANCKFPEFGIHYEMNFFREVNDPASIVQTKMTLHGHFTATIPVLDMARGATISTPRRFRWEQTIGLILVDAETNEVVALMHAVAFGAPKCFVLETKVSYGYVFEVLVITSAMAMYESRRREGSKSTSRLRQIFRTEL